MRVNETRILAANSDDLWISRSEIISSNTDRNTARKRSDNPVSSDDCLSLFGNFIRIINRLGTIERFEVKDSSLLILHVKDISKDFQDVLVELESLAGVKLQVEIDNLKIKLTPF
ncbi:MAG: hypothetical protein ACFFD4_27930 [Candidatus Odinarchaeota archaeon]